MADQSATALAVSVAALVPGVYAAALPPLASVRGSSDDRGHLAASERYAAAVSGALVLGIAGVARSPEAGYVGLIAVVGFAAAYHYAVAADPAGAVRTPPHTPATTGAPAGAADDG